jgi:FixJ family two-component response regulator
MHEKVLVIEDDVEFANLLGQLLDRKGFETRVAYTGEEGIDAAASFLPAVIVQDLMLPDISGMDLLEGVKKASPASKVIIMTARGDEEVAVELMKAGALDYLKKPFESAKLFSTVDKVLQLTSSEQALEKLTKEIVHQNKEFFALNAFSSALLSVQPPREKYKPALEIVMNSMEGVAAVLSAVNPNGGRLYVTVSNDGDDDGLKGCGLSRNVGLMSYVSEIKKPAVVKDFANEKRFAVPEDIHLRGIKSAVAVPLLAKGTVRGVLAVFAGEHRDYKSSDIKLMTNFGNQLALSVDNDYLGLLLGGFQSQWQTALDAVPDKINIQNTDHMIIMANKASAEWAGLKVKDIIGQKCSWVFHSMKEPLKNCPVDEVIRTKMPVSRGISAGEKKFFIHAYPIFDQDGEVTMVVERVVEA